MLRARRSAFFPCWLGLALLVLPQEARGDADEDFRKALVAIDREQWTDAAGHLREAIRKDPQEAPRRVFISGVFSRPYLPHFFLGQALFQVGPNHCEEILQAWDHSLAQGIVQSQKRLLGELEEGRRTCQALLLPNVLASASQTLERATELDRRLPEVTKDPASARQLEEGRQVLGTARASFESGRESSRLQDLRAAQEGAERALDILSKVEVQLARQPSSEVPNPPSKTPGSITNQPVQTASQPVQTASTTPPGERQIETSAPHRTLEPGSTPPDPRPQTESKPAEPAQAPPPEATPPQTTEPEVIEPSATELALRGSENTALIRSIRIAEALLIRLQVSVDSPRSLLLDLQRGRLEDLLNQAYRTPTVHDRLQQSTDALGVVAAARAFLSGRAQETVEFLRLTPPTSSTSTALAAQHHLFLAAALHHLHRSEDEQGSQLDQAREAARATARLAPSLELSTQAFSPAFRDFFRETTGGS